MPILHRFHPTYLVITIIFIGLLHGCYSTPFSLTQNNKYLRSERFQVDITNLSGLSVWNPVEYTVSLANAFENISNSLQFLALDTITIEYQSGIIQFTSYIELNNNTSIKLLFYTSMPHSISKFAHRYLITLDFSPNLASWEIDITGNLYIWNSNSGVGSLVLSEPYINATNGITHMTFIRGMNVHTYNSSNVLDLNINIGGNETVITVAISSTSSTRTYLKRLDIFILVYNKQYFSQPLFASFFSSSLSGSAASLTYTNTTNVYELATMVGMSGFSIKGDPFLDFSISFSDSNSISLSSRNSQNWFRIEYILLNTYYCSHLTPFFSEEQDQCFAECPVRSLAVENNLTCQACPYDCYTCNKEEECLSCNEQLDFRMLNASRCVPLIGYFQTFRTQCQQCEYGCFECLSDSQCLVCSNGFELYNKICQRIVDPIPPVGRIVGGVIAGILVIIIGVVVIRKKCCNERPARYEAQGPNINEGEQSREQLQILQNFWHRASISTFSYPTCDICLDELTQQPSVKIRCTHIYHVACIVEWSSKNPTCPYCRAPIKDNQEQQIFCSCYRCNTSRMMTFASLREIQNNGTGNVQFRRGDCDR